MTTGGTAVTAPADGRLPRCCPEHGDWRTLAEHLLDDFGDLAAADVLRELRRAKSAVEGFALSGHEEREVAELMTRHQLMMLSGRALDVARLDPERHVRSTVRTVSPLIA